MVRAWRQGRARNVKRRDRQPALDGGPKIADGFWKESVLYLGLFKKYCQYISLRHIILQNLLMSKINSLAGIVKKRGRYDN